MCTLRRGVMRSLELPEVLTNENAEVMGTKQLWTIQCQRFRAKHGDDSDWRPAGEFHIAFTAPVRGPLCLGHSCYFGLGLFEPSSPSPFAPRETR